MKAAKSCPALGYVGRLSCVGIISRFGRQARLGEHVDSGLTAYRHSEASDTGQNASKAQDAFRSLHYVAEATCRPPLIPAVTTIFTPHFGGRPQVAWGQPPKSMPKTLRYFDIFRNYRLDDKNENSMRNILKLILFRSKKV